MIIKCNVMAVKRAIKGRNYFFEGGAVCLINIINTCVLLDVVTCKEFKIFLIRVQFSKQTIAKNLHSIVENS